MTYIILAEPCAGQERQCVTSSKTGALSVVLEQAAMFVSPNAANKAAKTLLKEGLELREPVRLKVARVSLRIDEVHEVPRPAQQSGFVIRRADGELYAGPKGRMPNCFKEARYRYAAALPGATVFPSREYAGEVAEAARAILRAEAERSGQSPALRKIYEDTADAFAYTIEQV